MEHSNNISSEETLSVLIKNTLYQISNNWYWYILSLFICSVGTWLYLRYAPAIYTVKASLLVKDEKSKIGGAENFLDGLDLLSSSRNVQNEIELLRSFDNIEKTIKELNFDISYYAVGNIRTGELYKKCPFQVKLDTNFTPITRTRIYIEILTDSTFLVFPHLEKTDSSIVESEQEYKFGEHCHSSNYSFILHKTNVFSSVGSKKSDYYFVINDIEDLTQQYSSNLKLDLSDKKSSILVLSLNCTIPEKGIDFLNKLSEVYIETGLREKNQIAVNTIHFIDTQLDQITDSLRGAENRLEKFRSSEKIMDLGSTATNAFEQLELLQRERAELIVKDRYYHYLLDYLSYDYDIKKIIAPSAMGIQDNQLNSLIAELHNLYTEKTSLSFSTNTENPAVHVLELKVDNTKKTLIETLRNIIKASDISLSDNQNRLNRIQVLVDKLPSNERNLVNIQRRFLLNENIYNYLMQKRVEAGIAKAANLADNKVVNKAKLLSKAPVSPKKSLILLFGLIIGLLVPSSWLYAKAVLNDTIISAETIELYTKAPLIGSINHYKDLGQGQLPIISSPKSGVSESIRSLRINLKYLAADKPNKIIGITSSISGEGKTFFSSNLAASIAMSGFKVIIIGADLRKPKLNKIFSPDDTLGLSNYYINQASVTEIIKKSHVPNLDVILSGPTPPNPTELLESHKTEDLFSFLLKHYEYIIIDAPPVGLVADYYLLSQYIDADLYLLRQNHTPKISLKDIQFLYETKKLKNMFIVFNDVKHQDGYGYGYQYGYYEDEKKKIGFLKKLQSKYLKKIQR